LNNKESSRLPVWLKLLSLLTLALVGAPTVASAHGGHGEPTTGWEYVAENANVDQSVAAGTSEQNHFFEASNRIPGAGWCHGSCCCCQGMVHCGSSGCSLSALDARNAAPAFDPRRTRFAFPESQLPPRLHCYSGLERPPKRNLAACGVGLFGPA
jgi:hypothetical protein